MASQVSRSGRHRLRPVRPGLPRIPRACVLLVVVGLTGCNTALPWAQPSSVARRVSAPPLTGVLTSWQLPAPISRAVVLAGYHGLVVVGGLETNGQSASGVFRVHPANGSVSLLGTLPDPVHDAAGAVLGGRILVFGGGSSSSIGTVQSFTSASGGHVVGQLPTPRSDLTAAVFANRVYLVGGYDGINMAPNILETADGTRFRVVTQIPVPVRYPAAAGLRGRLFVFGGQTGSGETSAIQEVNISTRRARIVGHLPVPLSHASAVSLRGFVYVLGGRTNGVASRRIWSFDEKSGRVSPAGLLPMALSDVGVATVGQSVYLIGGEGAAGPTTSVIRIDISTHSTVGFGMGEYPFSGRLLIADRGNNRLLLVSANKHVLWTYPSSRAHPPSGGFYYPDDAFFVHHGQSIVVNEEQNEVVVRLAFPSGRLQWSYGHPGVAGGASGYLREPDDAYLLKNGQVMVADNQNCRVLILSPADTIVRQIGTTGVCSHQPSVALGSPNGDTPLPNGNVLISEINGSWISEYTPQGRIVWTVHLAIAYPSDPQQIGPDRFLVADYSSPGGLYEFNRSGNILWSYNVPSGPGMLDHPSLVERLPNGLLMANDDYRHRIVVINPVTESIVWQYGQTDIPGTKAGSLNTPDGFDLLGPDGYTPTHASTG
jgi:hypothetical protein